MISIAKIAEMETAIFVETFLKRLKLKYFFLCSICTVRFNGGPKEFQDFRFCLVGVAKDYKLNPRSVGGGFIYAYRMVPTPMGHHNLELVHKTSLEEIPYAMCAYQGKVLIGVGKLLRLYDLGRKKMLRKCENKHIPHIVVGIQSIGDRIIVSDVQESVHFVKYRPGENQLVVFADDTSPRWVTSVCILDYATVAIGDKFGNISIIRLPSTVNDNVDEDPTGTKALWDRGLLNGASQKAETLSVIHIGEIPLALQKANLIPGGNDSLVYTTLSGKQNYFDFWIDLFHMMNLILHHSLYEFLMILITKNC